MKFVLGAFFRAATFADGTATIFGVTTSGAVFGVAPGIEIDFRSFFGAVFEAAGSESRGFFFKITGMKSEAPSSDAVEPPSSYRFDSFPDNEDFDA